MSYLARTLLLVSLLVLAPRTGLLAQDSGEAPVNDPRAAARAEIARGTREGVALAPYYLELASAEARLGNADAARIAFIALLAVDPGFRLPREETEDVRSPYLEARGFWSPYPSPFSLDVRIDEAQDALLVVALDPANLAVRVRVRARVAGAAQYTEKVAASTEPLVFPLRGRGTVEYGVALIDEHGNRLFVSGDDQAPKRLREPALADTPALPVARAPERGRRVLAGLSFGVAGAALAGAVFSHVRREHEADVWNSGDCAGDGATRDERCGDEHTAIRRYERSAGALYGVSALGVAVGVVTLLWPRHTRDAPTALACDGGHFTVGARCRVSF